ncbi:restriction endonuclease subunit S [Xenorhabdus lircayensis]|uniref:Restriction endonuclease subunit S n=1 Tax=Xenorhabdus lircayensis TaxID=2763499 RepID=A0ABS0U7B5_9GAMM|nr:restriction endonuclease subunit S [Xenorhabdus lircayensis]MBI6549768.1 restriction endonuclease subunit S [Xenorhabdus lircayensis]
MSNEKTFQPALRFNGFEGDWDSYKLIEIGDFKNGMNFGKDALGHGYPFVNLQDVFGKNVVDGKYLGLAKSSVNQRKEYSLKKGDILFIRSSVKPEGVGEAALVSNDLENTTYSGFMIRFRPQVKMSGNFNRFVFSTRRIREQILMGATSSANTNINQNALGNIQGYFPKFVEQTQIGNFFQNIDQQLKLHQSKYTKLQQLKKAMLGKMFPKAGAKVPEVRFAGFSGDWEKKVLGIDIADIIGGGTPNTMDDRYWDGDIDWYSPTEIGDSPFAFDSVKKITQLGLSNSSAKKLPAERTILFTSRAGIGDMAILKKEATTNQGFQSLVLKEGFDTYFIYSMGHLIKEYAMRNASGSTFLEISGKLLRNMKVKVPTKHEQTKIGNYFHNLDRLIALQQQHINKLKNIKQACLEKMFV